MRRYIVVWVVALVAVVAAAAPAQGYRLAGHRWPTSTVTYYNGTVYKDAVRAAVEAWNASGARVRFRETTYGKAGLLIGYEGFGCQGSGSVARFRRPVVLFGRGCGSSLMPLLATHEIGHILGLAHEDRRCATMSSAVGLHCPRVPPYMWRCRLLEADDVRGAVRIYGGAVKPVSPVMFCPLFAVPDPPVNVTLAYVDGSVDATLTIPEPRRLVAGDESPQWPPELHYYRYSNACPPGDPTGTLQRRSPDVFGTQTLSIDSSPPPGTWCYAMSLAGYTGGTSPFVTATVLVP